jgi:hypothetical protein
MGFVRSRTQILYRYVPGAIFEHDKYCICRVTGIAVTAPDSLNAESLRNVLAITLNQWRGYGGDSFPDPISEWGDYKVGVPERVNFEPFPVIVECSDCGHINSLAELSKLTYDTKTVCIRCKKGRYKQLSYVVIHECGKLDSMPVPKCPVHGKSNLSFNDTGRFVTSLWRCDSDNYVRGMPRYQCDCAFSRITPTDENSGGSTSRKNDKYVRINDTSVLYSHTLHFVNLPENSINKLRQDSNPTALLLAKLWGLIDGNIFNIADERRSSSLNSSKRTQEMALVEQLLNANPNDENIKQLASLMSVNSFLPYSDKVEVIEHDLPGTSVEQPSLGLIEHTAILDSLEVLHSKDALSNIKQRGDAVGALDFEEGLKLSSEKMGFNWICCITNFTIAMASFGYSRVSNIPGKAFLNPFYSQKSGGKVPIYAINTNAEAIMIQLDPAKVVKWLITNNLAISTVPHTEYDSWVWLRKNLTHLSEFRGLLNAPKDLLSSAEKAVLTLLHTISHLLMKQIEWSGFDPESVSEYLIPETLTMIIHTNNYASFTIGGMVTMFEQRLHAWLQDVYNASFDCVYNPICEDEGGSCSGCLHRQYNCESFNQYLSRSVLKGGILLEPQGEIARGFWTTDL